MMKTRLVRQLFSEQNRSLSANFARFISCAFLNQKIRNLGLLLFLCAFQPGFAQTVVFGVNDSPPFWSEQLPYNGMLGEILQAMTEQTDLSTEIEFYPLRRLIEDDRYNDVGNPLFYMRHQNYSAIIPIAIYQPSVFYYRPNLKQPPVIRSADDLRYYRMGVLSGSQNSQFFKQYNIQFEASYSQASLFKKLQAGRIDLVVEIDLLAKRMIKRLFPKRQEHFVKVELPKSVAPLAIMLSVDQENVVQIEKKYRQALQKIIDNGRYHQILTKYYAQDLSETWLLHLNRFTELYRFIR